MIRIVSAASAILLGCAAPVFIPALAPAFAQEYGQPLSTAIAQRRLENYVHTWSTNAGINPGTVGNYYAVQAIYYGKPMSRSQILADKLRYISTWPERHYRIVPGTVSANCDGERTLCRVSGIMQWDRRSRSGARSVGSARLSLTLSRDSGGKIVRESASLPHYAGGY